MIDNNVLEKYEKYYFSIYKRAKKKPIPNPYHPSINQWMILKRPIMNQLKQKYKEFMLWFIKDLGYENLLIQKCKMKFITYYKTKVRHDVDNSVPKFILDGLAESQFIVDDDSKHLISLVLECDVDAKNPRTEIYIEIL